MRRVLLFVLVLSTAPFHQSIASESLAQPSPNLLFQLQKQNRSHPWLRVATDSARLTYKVRRIDHLGLHELTVPRAAPPPLDLVTWAEIERIDEVVTRANRGRVMGAIVLGLAGAGLGNALGAPDGRGGNYAILGVTTMGSVGGWIGGRYGERFKHERNWYIAGTKPGLLSAAPPASEAPLTSPVPFASAAPLETVTPTQPLSTSRAVIRASNRIGKQDVIRITGTFGRFQGFADLAGPAGLEGLHLDPKARGEWAAGRHLERISWEAIDEVRMRGGSAMMGALSGAASFGLFGALLGAAAVTVANGNGTAGEGALAGAGILAPVGALFGAGAGSLVRRWVVVYRAE
jgi:hypothetical protein